MTQNTKINIIHVITQYSVNYDLYFFPIIGHYEVLPTEPLYDIKEHIANVVTGLPSHLENEEKMHFKTSSDAL